MARLRSADGADRAECGPVFTGDSPSSGPPLPFPVSLVLRPAQHISNTYSLQLMFWVLCISEKSEREQPQRCSAHSRTAKTL